MSPDTKAVDALIEEAREHLVPSDRSDAEVDAELRALAQIVPASFHDLQAAYAQLVIERPDLPHDTIMRVLGDATRGHPPGAVEKKDATIVVRAGEGARIPDFDPSRELGVPDPEIEHHIAVGQQRYHLDTLDALESESHAVHAPTKPRAAVLAIGSMSLMALALCAGITPTDGVNEAHRRAKQKERDDANRRARENVAVVPERARTGCRGAGCRTLDRCMCSCRKCRQACR